MPGALLILADGRGGMPDVIGGILIILGSLVVVGAVIAAVYFWLIKGTRTDNPPAEGDHRPGPGRS